MSGRISFLPGTQLMILGRREKGRKVLICARKKKSVMGIPVDISVLPSIECKIVFHIVFSSITCTFSSHHSVKTEQTDNKNAESRRSGVHPGGYGASSVGRRFLSQPVLPGSPLSQ